MKTPKWIVLASLAAALAPAARATTPVAYTISYDLDGGTLPSGHPTTYTSESAVTLVNPTRTGYDFAGWTWPGQGAGGDNDTPDADLAFVVLSPGPKQGCTSTVKFYANNEAAALARVPNVYVHWGATDAGGNTAWTDVPGDPMTWVDADGAWEAQIAVPADAVSLSFLFNDGTTWLFYNDVRGGDQTEWMCEVAAGSAEPNTPQTSVTIPAGSTGDKFFTAHWTPTPWQALQAQLDAGGTVTLASDVTAETNDVSLVVTNAVTLDLNGCLINADGLFGAIRVAAGGDLTLTNGAGGAIAGGNAEYGGGVYVDAGGAFTMAGGWIAFGSAKSGGGVYVAGGTFKMTGGTIANNTAEESGGGVRVAGGAFEMTGGTISGNTAARYGGGVCVDGGGSMRMSGGTISGNTGTGAGGGVYLRENGAFAVSGAPVVFGNYGGPCDDNVHLVSGTAVVVDGLSAGASIGVTADEVPTSSAPVVVATGAAAGDEARFSSDNPAFGVGVENGEVRLLRQTTPWERLQALLDAGGANGVVTLTNDVAATSVDSTLVVTNAVTLDLNGHRVDADGRFCVVRIAGGGALTLANGAEDVGALAGGRGSDGGGVLVEDGGAFTMAGGDVAGNSSDRGGGVYVRAGGAFAMDGGAVSYNFSRSGGGGVHVETGAAFSVSGSPVVAENADFDGEPSNVFLEAGATIAVNGLAAGASLGVTPMIPPLLGTPLVVAIGAATGDDAFFFADNPVLLVSFSNGKVWLEKQATDWDRFQLRLDSTAPGRTVKLTDDVVATAVDRLPLAVTNAVTLDLNGHTIAFNGSKEVFHVGTGGDLTITNGVEGAGAVTGGGDHGVYVGSNAVLRLRGGAIVGNVSDYAGGGVFVNAFGTFEMSGGSIADNAVRSGIDSGGGVFVVEDGAFTMTGGEISGNEADYGGGVFLDGGSCSFEMTGGAISGNTARKGGGVFLRAGSFAMAGGEISGNEADYGGGVFVDGGAFTMDGGRISGNSADFYGGGVYVDGNEVGVSGDAVVFGNVNAESAADNFCLFGGWIHVGYLSADASIGVNTWDKPTVASPLTFATIAFAGDEARFSSDNPAFVVDAANNELRLRKLPTAWDRLQAQLDAGGTVTLASNVTATAVDTTLAVTNAVTLDLNGHRLDAAGLFSVVWVADGGRLALADGAGGGAVTGGKGEQFGDGSAVFVYEGGTFTMVGGAITNNSAHRGGGVFVYKNGAFEMAGGMISGNTADGDGGGVYLAGGATFEMSGGAITNNSAHSGGGVFLDGGSFEMTGGTISGNDAGNRGGGVCMEGSGSFEMTGGAISGNTVDWDGGGVYVNSDGSFEMSGGAISGNTVDWSGGGGIHVETGAAFSVSGSPVVSENADFDGEPSNVILETDATIAVNGLAAGASFGVTTDTTPLIGAPVVVVTNAAPGDAAHFFADNPACYVRFDGGSLWLAVAQYCRVDWSGSENVVVTTNGAEAVGGTDYREGTVLAFRPLPGMVVTNVDGAAVYLEGWDYVVEPVDSTNLVVLAGAETRARPAWAAAADDFSFWRWVETERVADYATEDYTAQYLLNVAPGATLWSLRIGGIEPVDGGAQIEVLATAGRGVVDLAAINGVLYVDVGAAATNLVPKAVPSANVRHDAETHVATVFVPESDGAFARARVGFPGFSNGNCLEPRGAAVAGLEIRPEAGTQVPAGGTIRLRAVGILADGTEVDVSPLAAWTSADPEKATVARGVVRGVVEDDDAVTVTARAFGFEASVDVKVGYNYIILNSVREDVPDIARYLGYTVEIDEQDICRIYKGGVEATDLVLPATFVHGNVPYCISGFNQEAFLRCVNLRSVILPDTASYVGVSAFAGCTNLQSVSMAPIVNYIGEYAFQDCAALEELTLPDELTYLLESTFENCTSLTNIVVPALVGWIDKKAFAGCGSLRTVTLPASLESIGEEAFRDCGLQGAIDLPSCVESLGRGAFKGCAGLEAVAVPARITGLPDELFSGCENLQTVALFTGSAADPPVLASIGSRAFEGCRNLESITIPGLTVGGTYRGVTDIGEQAFKGCYAIVELTVPDGVERIGDEAFAEVQHITYHGTADGQPWGANEMN